MISFLLTTIVFALTPGPAMLYSISHTLAFGRADGMKAVLGIHVATYIHIGLAAAGLSVLLRDLPMLFFGLRMVGCGYLVFLGLAMLLRSGAAAGPVGNGPVAAGGRRPVTDAVLTELLNPKTALFFVAFLPQFADPAGAVPIWLQVLLLGIAANAIFSMGETLSVVLAESALSALTASARRRRMAMRVSGLVLIALAALLAHDRI